MKGFMRKLPGIPSWMWKEKFYMPENLDTKNPGRKRFKIKMWSWERKENLVLTVAAHTRVGVTITFDEGWLTRTITVEVVGNKDNIAQFMGNL